MALLLYGKAAALQINNRISQRADSLKQIGVTPLIAVIRCGESPSSMSYEKGLKAKALKLGIEVRIIVFEETAAADEIISTINQLNEDISVHGILILGPLPESMKEESDRIYNTISPIKDVDGMTDLSNSGVYNGKRIGFASCAACAVIELLKYYSIPIEGKRAVVIGRSLIVGRPAAMLLMAENATVTICHRKTVDLPTVTKDADIIVTSAGALGLITKEYVSRGQVIIDVSVNWDADKNNGNGDYSGDCVFEEVEPIVSAITPVPGGVGAMTTTILLEHLVTAAEYLINN